MESSLPCGDARLRVIADRVLRAPRKAVQPQPGVAHPAEDRLELVPICGETDPLACVQVFEDTVGAAGVQPRLDRFWCLKQGSGGRATRKRTNEILLPPGRDTQSCLQVCTNVHRDVRPDRGRQFSVLW